MIKTALVLIFIVLFVPVVAFGQQGQPFKALQEQIDQLKIQLQNIQLTPGPPGPAGPTGATGATGPKGVAGASFDVSKLYTITSHHDIAKCNNDDVAISCTAECSTHPDYQPPTYPFPAPFYGVPEEVINIAFGINFNTESAYAYEDHQPGVCVSKCIVPPGTMGFPQPNTGTYEANVRVLCMPRN